MVITMKRIIAILLCAITLFALCSCALTEESDIDATLEALKDAEEITAHLYADEEISYTLEVTDELCDLVSGKWEAAGGQDGGKKVLTLTVGTQHEITFFDNGVAMVYYGYANVLEKDRRYYTVALDCELDELYDYIEENGKVLEEEDN